MEPAELTPEEVEIFVITEQPLTADTTDLPADAALESTAFEVHLADQPPEEGGPVWLLPGDEAPDPEQLHDALLTGLVTEVPRALLEEASSEGEAVLAEFNPGRDQSES
jgi:hypothetical protein